jgi:predicted pyridoxine 5'-phosphate oxidase superfamily flavin-nucleotide-binding protein
MDSRQLPGSDGEHRLQEKHGTVARARAFYDKQVLDYISPSMREFLREQEMFFLATADARGECDCSFRAGEKGFVRVLDQRTLLYPEYCGNGVRASLGNVTENPHVALLFLDFFHDSIGLHVNGKATIWTPEKLLQSYCLPSVGRLDPGTGAGQQPELWVVVEIEEAYVHCSKHLPRFVKLPKEIDWGTDDVQKKGGDYFHVKGLPRPWSGNPATPID